MVLSSRERDDLHSAMLEYLQFHGFTGVKAQLEKELAARSADGSAVDAATRYVDGSGALERRWGTLRRLNQRVQELEAQVKTLEAELAVNRGPPRGTGQMAERLPPAGRGKDLLPAAPAVMTLKAHKDAITGLVLHPTEPLLLSSSEDGTVRVWDIEQRAPVQVLRHHTSNIHMLLLEPTRHEIIASCSNDTTIKLYQLAKGGSRGGPIGAAPEESGLICSSHYAWECTATLIGHDDAVTTIAWLGDEQLTLLSCSRDGAVKIWDASRAALRISVSLGTWVRTVATTPLGGGQVLLGGKEEKLFLFTNVLKGGGNLRSGAAAMSSSSSPSGESDGISVLEGHTNVILCCQFSNFEADCVYIEACGTTVEKAELKALARRKENAGVVGSSATIEWLRGENYTPKYAVSGGRDKNIFIYELHSGRTIGVITEHQNWVRQVQFSANGKYIISCGDDGMLLVIDFVLRKAFRRIKAHDNFTTCLALHYYNKPYMATGSADSIIKVWPCD